jgi:hypothetical protein
MQARRGARLRELGLLPGRATLPDTIAVYAAQHGQSPQEGRVEPQGNQPALGLHFSATFTRNHMSRLVDRELFLALRRAGNFMTSNRTLLALCVLVGASWIVLIVVLWRNPLW